MTLLEAPIGIILCKKADRAYVEYIMQDFRQPMGVATYKTADEMEPELLKVLPPKEELHYDVWTRFYIYRQPSTL